MSMRGLRSWRLTAYGLRLAAILVVVAMAQPPASYAEEVSSTELIEKARALDGHIVTYKGEAVTAVLNCGGHAWVNLNDGGNAIGVWCDASVRDVIRFTGDYKYRGDMLEVEGVFHRACPLHGGELDIHADRIEVIRDGFPIEDKPDMSKFKVSVALFAIIFLIIILRRKRI